MEITLRNGYLLSPKTILAREFKMMMLSWNVDNLVTVHGYNVPRGTCKQARNVLKKLRKYGFVMFEHDDSNSLCTRLELEAIADHLGFMRFDEPYSLSIVDNNGRKRFVYKGSASNCI